MRLDAASDQGRMGVQRHLSRDLLPVLLLWAFGFSLPKCLPAQRSLQHPVLPGASLLHRPSLRNEAAHPTSL